MELQKASPAFSAFLILLWDGEDFREDNTTKETLKRALAFSIESEISTELATLVSESPLALLISGYYLVVSLG